MRALFQLLIAGILACVSMATAAPISEFGSTADGDISWYITGSNQEGGYDTDISGTHAYITGVNGVGGGGLFEASISAETNAGDYAKVWAMVDNPNLISNLGLYGYLAPTGNLAWTGLYADELSGQDFDIFVYSTTHGEANPYERSGLALRTINGVDDTDFKATEVYVTSQAGGSEDSDEFDVTGGSYAMTNLEYGTFSIDDSAPDTAAWKLWDSFAGAWDGSDYLQAWNADYGAGVVDITGPGSAFKVNSINMNYADAGLAYSNIDWGVVSSTSDSTLTGLTTTAENQADDLVTPDAPVDADLSDFDNVFSYALAVDGDIEADTIFY